MKFCSLLVDKTQAFMSCNVFFFIMKPKPETGRVFTTTLPLGFISSNLHKYIWDSNFAIVRWCLHELWKNQEREMFPKIFLQSQFQGGRRTVLFRNSNFDPISWFKVFLHEQPCKIFQASCSSSKEEEPTHFSSFKLDNFLPFPLSSIVLSWKKLDGSFLLKIGFFFRSRYIFTFMN